MNQVPDIAAMAAQQKMERLAADLGFIEIHPIIVSMQQTQEGLAVAATPVATCSKCYALVRGDHWEEHATTHVEHEQKPWFSLDPSGKIEVLNEEARSASRVIGEAQEQALLDDMRSPDA